MDIPVFCYHNAFAAGLEKDLAFLAANGYRTLSASELVDALRGATPPPEKGVALTFDDGLLSLETVGLPLLERYDARATLFAITGLTPEGRTEPAGEGDLYRLLGWEDLRALQESGRFEIGSHGHRHNPVHVPAAEGGVGEAPTPAGAAAVARVRIADYDRLYDVPMAWRPEADAAAIGAADGRPSHPSRPLFAAETILVDGRPVSAREAVIHDLRASAALLRARLGIERPHLCLPYGAGNETIPDRAREAGFASLFWSRRPDRSRNEPGDDPYRIVRRKHDFVRRLPGGGRRSMIDVVLTKVRRRLGGDPWE